MGSCQPAPLQPRPSGWLHLSSRHSESPSAGLIITIRAWSRDCHVGQYTVRATEGNDVTKNEKRRHIESATYLIWCKKKKKPQSEHELFHYRSLCSIEMLSGIIQFISIKFLQSKHLNTPNLTAYVGHRATAIITELWWIYAKWLTLKLVFKETKEEQLLWTERALIEDLSHKGVMTSSLPRAQEKKTATFKNRSA